MRDRFDHLAKDAFVALLEDAGTVNTHVEVVVPAQYADTTFAPSREGRKLLLERGLLGRMANRVCMFEAFHQAPSIREVRGCVRKLFTWHHDLTLEADKCIPPERAPFPRLWLLCAGEPRSALRIFRLRHLRGWPPGIYSISPWGVGLFVAVIPELPRDRTTLALRLLGKGAVLREAARELQALPESAWEHKLIPILLSWKIEIASQPTHSQDEEDFMTAATELVRKWREEALDEGRREGMAKATELVKKWREEARDEGRNEGLREGMATLCKRRLGRALTAMERAGLVARLNELGPESVGNAVLDLEPEGLANWLVEPQAR